MAVIEQPESQDYIDQLLLRVNQHLSREGTLPADLLQRFPQIADGTDPKTNLPLAKKKLFPADLQDPELQQGLAYQMKYTPSEWLLEQEKDYVIQRRTRHNSEFTDVQDPDIYDWARKNQVTGLCFSGGGIRSATFNLGVLQALASKDCLKEFDYLSSVSGGGYIHSFFAAWLLRKSREEKDPLLGWRSVMQRLHPLATGDPAYNQYVWPRQIQWLRRYSNYLTPRKGAMSGDTWAAAAIWLRNVLLNQALLLTIFLVLLCVPHVFAPHAGLVALTSPHVLKSATVSSVAVDNVEARLKLEASTPPGGQGFASDYGFHFKSYFNPDEIASLWHSRWFTSSGSEFLALWPHLPGTGYALIFYLWGCISIGGLLWLEYRGARPGTGDNVWEPRRSKTFLGWVRRNEFGFVCLGVVLPLFLFGGAMTFITASHPASFYWTVKVFCLLLLLVWVETFCGGALSNCVAQEQERRNAAGREKPGRLFAFRSWLGLLLLGIPAALTGAALTSAIAALLHCTWMVNTQHWLLLNQPWPVQLTAGTLLYFWMPPLTMVVASGMIGKLFPVWMGEWLGRIRGYTLLTGIVWVGFCGGTLLLPGMVIRIASYHWVVWSSVGTWIVTTATGVISGKSGKTSGDQNSASSLLDAIAVVAPFVYIAGLLVLLAWLIDVAQNHAWVSGLCGWLLAMLVLCFLGGLLQWRLDINQFSMHTFYRNRLTRCYLGASNAVRNPSPVTGFDEHDSMDLCIDKFDVGSYPGPIPIFSCALNITTGEDLAWQERKAASFAFTPYYSGYTVGWAGMNENIKFNGFVPTCRLYPGGPTIATAVAASGAAVSPNWGYHTNPATAFLLTMFDARLGLWVPNPRRSELAGRKPAPGTVPPASPRCALVSLMGELTGSVDDTSRYVYVTDGGHFDNSGLYELVRRRCYRIVICDAEEDENYVFEGIGAAIQKCRIDFGVEIELDLSGLVPNEKTNLSPTHVAKGFIRYPETAGDDKRGTVTYIKSSLTPRNSTRNLFASKVEGAVGLPNVPGDVQAYKRQHKDFPHDSTAEQWFTESQFESYRRLGQRIVDGIKDLF
jgi:hypothetical protein